MIVAVTGVRVPEHPLLMKGIVSGALKELGDVTEFRTGGAFGVDTAAYHAALAEFPGAAHRVFYPEGLAFNKEVLIDACSRDGVGVTAIPDGYMARNDALIAGADLLVAFPATSREIARSGTWATVRRARTAGVRVSLNPLT